MNDAQTKAHARLKIIAEAAARKAGEAQKAGAAAREDAINRKPISVTVPTPPFDMLDEVAKDMDKPLPVAIATRIYVHAAMVICPHCNSALGDWKNDPRGKTIHCAFCDKEFRIVTNATLIFNC